jgi:hypothetical protein
MTMTVLQRMQESELRWQQYKASQPVTPTPKPKPELQTYETHPLIICLQLLGAAFAVVYVVWSLLSCLTSCCG